MSEPYRGRRTLPPIIAPVRFGNRAMLLAGVSLLAIAASERSERAYPAAQPKIYRKETP